MRVIALLALIFGFMMQMFLDGQVFTHAVFGIVCGITAVGCGLASTRKDRRYRWEGWIMAGLGFALGVWCVVMIPSTYQQQERFNDRTRKYRERMERKKLTPTMRSSEPGLPAPAAIHASRRRVAELGLLAATDETRTAAVEARLFSVFNLCFIRG